EAVCAVHGLNAAQIDDVRDGVTRWIASPVAREMASHAHLLPEPPFYVRVPVPGGTDVTLDGFIDLMAFDELGAGTAHVVDYKTGRFLDTDEKRRNSYEVQAKCYAYALMLQGFEEVRLSFVFVDQPDGEGHPQVCAFPAPGEQPYDLEGLRAYLSQKVSELR
ncbi:MAG: PD-(D/E)XK nuclease family protein, partial [Olsenella sp.]|nr:PD-(D/E)XK nuclease family protein [Olsenella sp.]